VHQDGFVCSVCRCHRLRATDRRLQSTCADDRGRRVADADTYVDTADLRTGDQPSGLRTADSDSNVAAPTDSNVAARADARVHPGSACLDQPSGRLSLQQLPKDHDL
jgi:hypothetical protein